MKDMGITKHCLGLEINQNLTNRTIRISQYQYVQGVLEKIGMSDCHGADTPFPVRTKLSKEMGPKTDEERELMHRKDYLGALGSIMYTPCSVQGQTSLFQWECSADTVQIQASLTGTQ